MDAARGIILLHDWETLPDNFSPHEDIISDRLMSRLPSLTEGIVIVSITTLMPGPAPAFVETGVLSLALGEELDIQRFTAT